jgi:predicted lipoprotein with Yx(FWY)xxD motif
MPHRHLRHRPRHRPWTATARGTAGPRPAGLRAGGLRAGRLGAGGLAAGGAAAAALLAAACGSSAPSSSAATPSAPAASSGAASSPNTLKTARIGGTTVVTNAKGFTLYSFAPDTSTSSRCNGTCARIWPPQGGPASAGSGISSGKLSTISRSGGGKQAAYNGHPLYTFTGDTAPGQDHGNGLDVNGGRWHALTASGAPAPSGSAHPAPSGSSGGYGY